MYSTWQPVTVAPPSITHRQAEPDVGHKAEGKTGERAGRGRQPSAGKPAGEEGPIPSLEAGAGGKRCLSYLLPYIIVRSAPIAIAWR